MLNIRLDLRKELIRSLRLQQLGSLTRYRRSSSREHPVPSGQFRRNGGEENERIVSLELFRELGSFGYDGRLGGRRGRVRLDMA